MQIEINRLSFNLHIISRHNTVSLIISSCCLEEIPNLKLSLLATSDIAKCGLITERAWLADSDVFRWRL